MAARNTSDPGYATVYIEGPKLPRYECPRGQWACPLPRHGLVSCIRLSQICDRIVDCPQGLDEDPVQCAFQRQTKALVETQQSLISQLQLQLELLREQFLCENARLRHEIRNHEHRGSMVHVGGSASSCQLNLPAT